MYDRFFYIAPSAYHLFPIHGVSQWMLNSLVGFVLTVTTLLHRQNYVMLWLGSLLVHIRLTGSFGVIIGAREDAVAFQHLADLEFALAFQPAALGPMDHPARPASDRMDDPVLVLEARGRPVHTRDLPDVLIAIGPIRRITVGQARRSPLFGSATVQGTHVRPTFVMVCFTLTGTFESRSRLLEEVDCPTCVWRTMWLSAAHRRCTRSRSDRRTR